MSSSPRRTEAANLPGEAHAILFRGTSEVPMRKAILVLVRNCRPRMRMEARRPARNRLSGLELRYFASVAVELEGWTGSRGRPRFNGASRWGNGPPLLRSICDTESSSASAMSRARVP